MTESCLPCPTLCFCFPAKVQAIRLQIGLHKWWAWYIRASSSHTDNILWNIRQGSPQIPPGICGSLTTQATEVNTQVIKGSFLVVFSMPRGCFPHQPFVQVWEFLCGALGQAENGNLLLAFLSTKWQALPAAGRLIGFCRRSDYWIEWGILALISCFLSIQGTNAETFSLHCSVVIKYIWLKFRFSYL